MKTEASVGLYASAGPSTSRGPRNFNIERSIGMGLSLGSLIESEQSLGRQPVDADDGGVEP